MTPPLTLILVAAAICALASPRHPRRARQPEISALIRTNSVPTRAGNRWVGAVAARILAGRRADRRDDQLPEFLERLASSMRAGSALGTALVEVAGDTPAPLGLELARVAVAIEHGAGIAAALARWDAQPASGAHVGLTADALGLAAECGGEVPRSVDRVAATLRERREMRAEVHALATQARASAAVLAVIPVGFTALISAVDPAGVAFLVGSPVGLLCLVSGLLLEALGAAWMARIVRSAA